MSERLVGRELLTLKALLAPSVGAVVALVALTLCHVMANSPSPTAAPSPQHFPS